jgi:5,10-methylenetetrahydromethanopterin reductase
LSTTTPESQRVGIVIPADIPAANFVAFVQRAEQLGFHEAWVVEDCFLRGAFAQAATVLAATSALGVGLGIIPAGARNVAFAAMEIATLAELHPGRLTVGVGHGVPSWLDQAGAWPRSPLTLLDEYIDVLRRLLAGDTVDFDGRYVHLSDVRLPQAPSVVPPVLAGVRGARSLQLSGRVAQGTILAEPVTPEYLAFALGQIAAADHEIVAYNIASVDDDPRIARSRVRKPLAVVGEPDWAPHVAGLDFAAELAGLRRQAGSAAAFADALPDSWVDRLAIVGDVTMARDRIRSLRRCGAGRVALIPAYPDLMSSLDSLARLL